MKAASVILGCVLLTTQSFASRAPETPPAKPIQRNTVEPAPTGCPPNTVARQYKVPREPETADAILVALFTRSDQGTANAEKRLLNGGWDDPENPSLFCLTWDVVKTDGKPDYITCRRAYRDKNGVGHVEKYPAYYIVDETGSAEGDMSKMQVYLDLDADGDICDQEFTRGEKKKEGTDKK